MSPGFEAGETGFGSPADAFTGRDSPFGLGTETSPFGVSPGEIGAPFDGSPTGGTSSPTGSAVGGSPGASPTGPGFAGGSSSTSRSLGFDSDEDERFLDEDIIGAGTERVRDVPDPFSDFLDGGVDDLGADPDDLF